VRAGARHAARLWRHDEPPLRLRIIVGRLTARPLLVAPRRAVAPPPLSRARRRRARARAVQQA
jgi:hypothetical protein